MKATLLTAIPFPIALRRTPAGTEILCPPGPFAQFLHSLTGRPMPPTRANPERRPPRWEAVPYTDELDTALMSLIDALISMRYESGSVSLTLLDENPLDDLLEG
jgi:hypothetical protein